MSHMKLDYAGGQDIGRRERQQDAFLIRECRPGSHIVGMLADGMGGHAAGEIAANLAIRTFDELMAKEIAPYSQTFDRLLDQANRALAKEVKQEPDYAGMGCTFVALEIDSNKYQWISIGDSLLYLYRKGQLRRENADHSMASRLDAAARAGDISWEEARCSPNRNALLHALTGEHLSRFDYQREPRQFLTGDWLILASDGIQTIPDDEIASILSHFANKGAKAVVGELLKSVQLKNNPSQDNISIVVIGKPNAKVRRELDDVVTRPILR